LRLCWFAAIDLANTRKPGVRPIPRLSFLLAAAALLVAHPAAAQKAWKTHKNARFGTSIEYPADQFVAQPPSEDGDGDRFVAADGGAFTVSAINNVLDQKLAALTAATLKNRPRDEKVTYRDHGPNWIVVSGRKAGSIFYERHLLSHRGRIINDFVITYPARLHNVYDSIVKRMSRSFSAGVGINTGPP